MGLESLTGSSTVSRASAGFVLLSASQLLAAGSYVVSGPREAYTLYVGSTASSLVGYILLLLSTSRGYGGKTPLIAPILALPAVLDLASCVASCMLASRTRGTARIGFMILSVVHFARFTSFIVSGSQSLYILLAGEVARVASVSLLSLYYIGGILRVGEKE